MRHLIRTIAQRFHWYYYSNRSRFQPVVALRRFDPFAIALCTAFESLEKLQFVQIGANDGVSNDPIYDFATRYHWAGLLYEPMKEPFRALQENYRNQPHCRPVNAAVSTTMDTLKIWHIENDGTLPEWASRIASTDREHIVRHRDACPEIIDHIVCSEVETIDIRTIVNAETKPDLLCIDAEGLDYDLVMAIDEQQLPPFICFEHSHLSPENMTELRQRFQQSEHELWFAGRDCFAFRPR
jgi:FkbM family methyltransferase